jgi:single-stranded DNA-binding protein
VERYSTKIIASEMQMLGGSPGDGSGRPAKDDKPGSPQGNKAPSKPHADDSGFSDEEIPF